MGDDVPDLLPLQSAVYGEMARAAKDASYPLAFASSAQKDGWLRRCAEALLEHSSDILAANAEDLSDAEAAGLSGPMFERLRLSAKSLAQASDGLRQVAALPDPVGRVIEGYTRPNGLDVTKVGVPLGVIFFLYESRPNVTIDAAGLCVKAGNAVILRGGKEALRSNRALHRVMAGCLAEFDLPPMAAQLVPTSDREAVGYFLKRNDCIDLTIPRGGESLIRRVAAEATMPVLKHYLGNCHVYIDRAADPEMALAIVENSKCSRPAVCNAAESVLIHRDIATSFLPRLGGLLSRRGVEVRGCEETRSLVAGAKPATEEDYAAEFCDLIVSIKVVGDVGEAVAHVRRFGSGHTEAIVTADLATARRWVREVDASAVLVNASTRFNDGYELGLGAEIGISTDKFHARGPCGLRELTSSKYVVFGSGQLRG